ncbi:MAG: glycoside hydrolase family 1 protein [Staphylothermus sp.]|nr:glycoside hydrolase family 1 protein [Staphylothermus sp.]
MSYKFPKDFLFGYSWSGFQFEMGLEGSEVPYSDWWVWVHDQENIIAGLVSGDLPENGPGYWHLYKQDHDIAESLGMNAIRGCVEWARIFPKPTFDVSVDVERDEDDNIIRVDVPEPAIEKLEKIADMEAVKHYREIFADWKERGKTFILNLYHWPLPLWLHDPIKVRKFGPDRAPSGWLDDRSVVEFAKFAAFISYHFDDLVDMWSTMNEPNVVYQQGYINFKSGFPPGYLSFEASIKAAKNMIQAHARAYDAIKAYSKKPVGLIYAFAWIETFDEKLEEQVNNIKNQVLYAFIDAVYAGRTLGTEERKDLKGRLDWIGVNYYSRHVFGEKDGKLTMLDGYGFNCPPGGYCRSGRPASDFGWEIYPEGLGKLLREIASRYNVPLMVTENGIADETDRYRSCYLVSHLYEVYKAVKDGLNVKGYLHWSLTDNYEWAQGFRKRFGLVYIDYNTKKRYLRPSAFIYKEIAKNKEIPEELSHLTNIDALARK